MPLFSIDDLGIVDNTELVTYQDMNPATEAFTSYSGVVAFREELPTSYRSGIAQRSCRFHLQASSLNSGATSPTIDSRLVDSLGVTWVITSLDLLSWKTRYTADTLELMS